MLSCARHVRESPHRKARSHLRRVDQSSEVRNCVDGETAGLLFEAVEAFKTDDAHDVLILTGTGTDAFCSGADLKNVGSLGARAGARDRDRWASRDHRRQADDRGGRGLLHGGRAGAGMLG